MKPEASASEPEALARARLRMSLALASSSVAPSWITHFEAIAAFSAGLASGALAAAWATLTGSGAGSGRRASTFFGIGWTSSLAAGSATLAIEEVVSTFAGGRRTLPSAGAAPIDQRMADGVVVAATGRILERASAWALPLSARGGVIWAVVVVAA